MPCPTWARGRRTHPWPRGWRRPPCPGRWLPVRRRSGSLTLFSAGQEGSQGAGVAGGHQGHSTPASGKLTLVQIEQQGLGDTARNQLYLSTGWPNVWPTLRLDFTKLSPSPAFYWKTSESIRKSITGAKSAVAPEEIPGHQDFQGGSWEDLCRLPAQVVERKETQRKPVMWFGIRLQWFFHGSNPKDKNCCSNLKYKNMNPMQSCSMLAC